jgi:hypothetical protein
MARWKLLVAHYLNVPGTEWEYSEMGRTKGGRATKVRFKVPRHLDPNEPADHTHHNWRDSGDGAIVVCHEGTSADPNDIPFTGDPTPDMEAIDDEAKRISASFASRWKHPIEALPGTFSQSLIDDFQRQMADVQAATKQEPVEGMSELLTAMAAMMKQNAELINALTHAAVPHNGRRA